MRVAQWCLATLGASALLMSASGAWAQSSLRYIGRAVGGQSVTLEMDSIQAASDHSVDFVYYLGNDRRPSQADCQAWTWTTFEDGVVHSPQSDTTSEMLSIVCDAVADSGSSRWYVFNPPSNVRVSPNGPIQCVIDHASTINVYNWDGEWALTDACGHDGYIHESQIEPVN